MKRPSRLANRKSLLDNTAYYYYTKYCKKNSKKFCDYKNYKIILNAIFLELAKDIVSKPSGVIMRGLGYFCVWRTYKNTPVRAFREGKVEHYYNFHTDGDFYSVSLLTWVLNRRYMNYWTIDRAVNHTINDEINLQLRRGFKFRLQARLARTFFKRKIRQV